MSKKLERRGGIWKLLVTVVAKQGGFLTEIGLCWFYCFKKFLTENQQQHVRNGARWKRMKAVGSSSSSVPKAQTLAQLSPLAALSPKHCSAKPASCITSKVLLFQGASSHNLSWVCSPSQNWPILFLPVSQSSAGWAKSNGRCAAAQNCRADVLSKKVLQLNCFFSLEVHIRRIYWRRT